jgi:predicted nucleotidyltransferase
MDALTRLDADRGAIGALESDVDLLVEFRPGKKVSLFDMARMEMELEEIIHNHRVDLRTPGDLSHRFRDHVVAEAEPVYGSDARKGVRPRIGG